MQVHVPFQIKDAIVIETTIPKQVIKGFLPTKIICLTLNSSLEMLAIVEKGAGIHWVPLFAQIKFDFIGAVYSTINVSLAELAIFQNNLYFAELAIFMPHHCICHHCSRLCIYSLFDFKDSC